MSHALRRILRSSVPPGAKRLVHRFRRFVAPPPIDAAVLADYRFVPDPSPIPRLNLVIPNLSPAETFGGIMTGIDIFLGLAQAVRGTHTLDLRLILTDHDQSTTPAIFTGRAAEAGFERPGIETLRLRGNGDPVSVRRSEIFVTYNWWTTLNIVPLQEHQARHFGQPLMPLIYLIQEYEPALYPLSSAHLLAREAYDASPRLWGIFNSSALESYFELQGHAVECSWTFEPVISDRLRTYLARVPTSQRKRQILIYGRPTVERNCFPALVRGLWHWASEYREFADWDVVSAGTPHPPVELGDGRRIRSLGKLSLEDYPELLLVTAVGVSLIASPHPSYPPLEMAHFGLRVVTNRYTCKDLSHYHPAIISLPSIGAAALAKGIAAACAAANTQPCLHTNPDFVRQTKYAFLPELAQALAPMLRPPSGAT